MATKLEIFRLLMGTGRAVLIEELGMDMEQVRARFIELNEEADENGVKHTASWEGTTIEVMVSDYPDVAREILRDMMLEAMYQRAVKQQPLHYKRVSPNTRAYSNGEVERHDE